MKAESDRAVIVVNSGRGILNAGLEMGRAIRLRGFATAVPQGALCASACALTWLAGSPRLLDANSRLRQGSRLCHIRAAGWRGMADRRHAMENGIAYEAVAEKAPEASTPSVALPYDPMSATTDFYSALAIADGETAAALVVPEKRGTTVQ